MAERVETATGASEDGWAQEAAFVVGGGTGGGGDGGNLPVFANLEKALAWLPPASQPQPTECGRNSDHLATLESPLAAQLLSAANRDIFRWHKCMLQLLLFAQIGVATAKKEPEHVRRQREEEGTGAWRRRKLSAAAAAAAAADGEEENEPPDLELAAPPSPPKLLLQTVGDNVLGGLTSASETMLSASGALFSGTATLAKKMLLLDRLKQQVEEAEAAAAGGSSAAAFTPEEEAILREKMTNMERILQEELASLQQQEVSIYVDKFTEAVKEEEQQEHQRQAAARLAAENARLRRIREIEEREAQLFPEPAAEEKILSAGDDIFTQEMKETGLQHVGADGHKRHLSSSDLPPPLDLTAFFRGGAAAQ